MTPATQSTRYRSSRSSSPSTAPGRSPRSSPGGACTVLARGRAIKSCTMLAVQVDGRDVTPVEGLASASELHPLQEGFRQEHGLQCGFCTPGMMLAAKALVDRNP